MQQEIPQINNNLIGNGLNISQKWDINCHYTYEKIFSATCNKINAN